ncbi:peptidase m16 inactive domain-containing protein [Cystoisospora suis]|uniref:Peptidase m16 inactive domain-containing protein n=1 Tax=Cystoisospora suis TaxID=483139 RepID=A0A2C6LF50_9APIC|nr:peptidase m16 inactive domain-containing protein [Cystoisospora suis]
MREKRQLGYSFSCHTASLEFQDSGVLIFGATPRPAYAAKAWDSLCCVIRDLCTHHPPTREEYHAAKQVLTSGFTTSFKTNDYWLTLLFSLQLPTSPKDLDSIKKIPEFYERISLQDVCDVLRETCFAVPMITCVAISGPKEIKSLLARTETAVEGKVKSYLLSLPHPSPSSSHQMIPWSETPAWPEDLPVDEEWESYTRRQALTRASCLSRWSSPTRWFSELSDFFYGDEDCKKKRKLLLFLGVAVLTGTAVMWMLSSRRRVSRR